MSYYEKGMGAALVAELNKERLTFIGGTGLLAIQLRDTCLFADAAAERIKELDAALTDADHWRNSILSAIERARGHNPTITKEDAAAMMAIIDALEAEKKTRIGKDNG